MLYLHHASSLDHDPGPLSFDYPDVPARIEAIEAAMTRADWLGCEVREAPAASRNELELVHEASYVDSIRKLSFAGGGSLIRNVAIAAELTIRELGIGKVLILDWDVHHGNGTAELFRRRVVPGDLLADLGRRETLRHCSESTIAAFASQPRWSSKLTSERGYAAAVP